MRTALSYCFILFFCLGLICCNVSRQVPVSAQEQFEVFYKRFHQDSIFQMQRIQQPLGGYKIEGQQMRTWQEVKWVTHKKGKGEIDESIYEINSEKQEGKIREKITIPNSTFLMERNFERINGKWFLVYCLEIFL